jgi:uncharacterized protein DUF1559
MKSKKILIAVFIIICIFVIFRGLIPGGALSQARPSAYRISCSNNLKQIGLALKSYADDYNGEFPPYDGAKGLGLLKTLSYLDNPIVYKCPCDEPSLRDNDLISYHYRGGLSKKDAPDIAIAWDNIKNHKDYGNILYLNGTVKSFEEKDWIKNTKK